MRQLGFAALLLLGCEGRTPLQHTPAERSVAATAKPPLCVGERLPTDLAQAKKPYPNSVAWSRDGSLVAAAVGQSGQSVDHVEGADGVVVWSAADGKVQARYRMYTQFVAFAPDAGRLAFASLDGSGILDLRTGCAQRWAPRGPLLAWHPDGRVVFVAGNGHVVAIDPASGVILHDRDLDDTPGYGSMGVSASTVVLLDKLHLLHVMTTDLARARTVSGPSEDIGGAGALAIAPSGGLVAAGIVESKDAKYPAGVMPGPPKDYSYFVRIVAPPEWEERERIPGDAWALAFSPDGASLAIADSGRLTVRNLATKVTRVLDGKISFAQQIAWSPDGRSLALADWRGVVWLYDAVGGAAPRVLKP